MTYLIRALNPQLYIRNPEDSALGKEIVGKGLLLIHEMGLEAFTFKKLADAIPTTEASVYRYFENKHRLLMYLINWYWTWLDYRLEKATNRCRKPDIKIKKSIQFFSAIVEVDNSVAHINEKLLYQVVIAEWTKSFFTSHVKDDNQSQLFQSYKQLVVRFASYLHDMNPSYPYSRTLASSIIEIAHSQKFYMQHLPRITNLTTNNNEKMLVAFLEGMVFSTLSSYP